MATTAAAPGITLPANMDMTVEEYLREQCDQQVKKLLAHAQERINSFRVEADRVKGELQKLNGVDGNKFSTV